MATETSASKRAETNGSGGANGNATAVAEEEVAETQALAVTAAPAAATPPTIQPVPAAAPGASAMPEAELSILSRGDSASGRWVIGGDGELMGEFSGDIECGGALLIGKGAEVTATIRGSDVTIAGLVRGNITALGRLRIASTGRLEGDARVGSLVVQEGGVHHGVIRVHPEGVPEIEDAVATLHPAAEPEASPPTRVDRVKKFWGEFF